jgi:hypothetical protein
MFLKVRRIQSIDMQMHELTRKKNQLTWFIIME